MKCERRKKFIRSAFILFFLMIMFSSRMSRAAFEDLAAGARSAGFAGAFVAVPRSAEDLLINPAAISVLNGISVHLFYTKPFGLAEMKQGNVSAIFPFSGKSLGLGAQSFGNDKYGESLFCAGFSAPIFKDLFLGSTVRYASLKISGYGSAGTFIFDLGVWAKLAPSVYWGTSVKNITDSKIGRSGEELPQSMTTGFMLSPISQFSMTFDLNKDTRFPLDIRFGAEYRPLKILALRAGIAGDPQVFAAGFSVKLLNIRIDYAFTSHSELGFTHLFSLTFCKGRVLP